MHVETKEIKIDARESTEGPGEKDRGKVRKFREQETALPGFREDAATPRSKGGGGGGRRSEEEPIQQGRTVASIEHNEPVRAVARRHERVGV